MAKRFLVGEIATLVYSVTGRIPVGAEVEIVEPLMLRDDIDGHHDAIRCYGVSYEGDPETLYVTPDQLRKLDPTGHPLTLVQWSACVWQPRAKETAPR